MTSAVRRVRSARWWAALACSGLSSCVGDTGELFPAGPLVEASAVDAMGSVEPPGEPQAAAGATLADDRSEGAEDPSAGSAASPVASAGERQTPVERAPLQPSGAAGAAGPPAEAQPAEAQPAETPPDGAATEPAPEPAEAPSSEPPAAEEEGAGEDEVASIARACGRVDDPLLLDFTSPGSDPAQALFGDFLGVLSGGTYVYPVAAEAEAADGLRSDVTAGDWHIWGSVSEQAGFGLFLDCQLLDASRFDGLAFRVSGEVQGASTITLLIGTASNEISRAWLMANEGDDAPSAGRCTPAQSRYDGSCAQARLEIAVSPVAREVIVPFSALGRGSPEPGVNPAEITTIAWALPGSAPGLFAGAGGYAVDLRIDDIRLVEGAAAPALD